MSLTNEQIAADFCAANPGMSVIVGNVRRDQAGVVQYLNVNLKPVEGKDVQEHKYLGQTNSGTVGN